MMNIFFVIVLAVLLAMSLWWGFRKLPRENMQIFAAVPVRRKDTQSWEGVNLTYYGILIACAQVFAVSIMVILMGALDLPWTKTLFIVVFILVISVPSAGFVAKIVEKKASTLTVGGASFVGMLVAPFILLAFNFAGSYNVPMIPFLAAMITSYAYGEGIGRLACISFGCCYGKPLSECGQFIQKLFSGASFVFTGKTKKIAYESGLDEQRVIPIQAITSIVYVGTGLVSTLLFLQGFYTGALTIAVCCTQLWRFVSEIFRADFRGRGRLSVYQLMSLSLVFYPFLIAAFFPAEKYLSSDIVRGLKEILSPFLIICLQGIWVLVFLYLGKSKVTGATMSFHVYKDRI